MAASVTETGTTQQRTVINAAILPILTWGVMTMTKANACFNVGGISGKHDVKDIKRGLDTLPGVLSVIVSNESRVSVDFDTTGTQRDKSPAASPLREGWVRRAFSWKCFLNSFQKCDIIET